MEIIRRLHGQELVIYGLVLESALLVSHIAGRPASSSATSQYKNRAPLHPLHQVLDHKLAHGTCFSSNSHILRPLVHASPKFCVIQPSVSGMSITMAISRTALCALLLLAIVMSSTTEAAKIETWNEKGCQDNGAPTNTFYVGGNSCQKFIDQGSVRVTEVSATTRISAHNQQNCEQASSVAQTYGPACINQGATKLRAIWIQG